ncbi:MAG: response regulator [Defluviitaleaceae bacterium]|nr:response regulator [Defluviitaleaceae bacterium]
MKNSKRTIFIVDDSKSNLVMASDALSVEYKVYTIDSGAKLFSMLNKIMPDLILLDVEMPEMNGFEVLSKLKADSRFENIPVIMLTALKSSEAELEGLSLGAVDFITKPFVSELLNKRISLHLQLLDYNQHLEKMVEEKVKELVELKNAVIKTTAELVESRDENTGHHIERTQAYVRLMILNMLKHDVYKDEAASFDIELAVQSCQLHDVGKISISDTILLKPGKLTHEEFAEIKKHPEKGVDIINKMTGSTTIDSSFFDYARTFAISHHEKWDGSGYPHGVSGENIPLLGRVMAVADVYDALVTDRPYKKAFTHNEATNIIKDGKGSHFDPALVELFLKIHNEFEQIAMG